MPKQSQVHESSPGSERRFRRQHEKNDTQEESSVRFADNRLTRWLIPTALLALGAVTLLLILVALGILLGWIPYA